MYFKDIPFSNNLDFVWQSGVTQCDNKAVDCTIPTLRGIPTNFLRNDLWDRLDWQALLINVTEWLPLISLTDHN